MYAFLRTTWSSKSAHAALHEAVPAGGALGASIVFKFHSFPLELAAFLATWTLLSLASHAVRSRFARRASAARPALEA